MSVLDPSVKTTIDGIFAEQQCYSLHLRTSTCEQRLAVLANFERVFKASFEKLYKAAQKTFLSRNLRWIQVKF